ncbi:MAG: CPBP family intramembrane metalloprotease [Candidatus Lokiarchaeota archaeon]|nr:CPBP family intramembrane metalloprotease [Candidatus Lokiarchaeota archaeon]
MNPPQSDEKVKKSRLKWYEQLGLFFLFSLCGILALGPIQWGNITLPDPWIYPYKIVLPFVFLLISLVLRRKTNLEPYFKIFFMFFTATSALLIVKLVFLLINSLDAFFTIPTNTEWGFSTVKFIEMFVIVSSVILINLIAQRTEHKRKIFEELYMKKGKLYLGLIIGFSGFFVFAIGAVFIAKYLFYGSALTWSAVFTWLPWILLFCFSNGILEEVLYRGLFLTRYEPFFNFHVYNLLQAIIFASIHIGVIYTSESLMFLGITFLLGLLFGLLTKKTDSLLASILFHAGTDFVVIIGIFVNL